MTPDQAIDEWIKQLRPPEEVHTAIRKKFKRLKMSAIDIQRDMNELTAIIAKQRALKGTPNV